MNVIVSNKQKGIIDNANIDAIKDLNGLFNVDDLINKFKNYFFTKMILDATSVIDFASVEVLKKLVDGIGSDRLIILLPSTPPPPDEFKKLLISLKIYNFSNNIDDVVKFIDNPNTYENVVNSADSYTDNNGFYVDNSIRDHASVSLGDSINNDVAFHSSLGDIMDKIDINNSGMNENNETNYNSFTENQNEYNTDLDEEDDSYDANNDQIDMTDYSGMLINQNVNDSFNTNPINLNDRLDNNVSDNSDSNHNVFLNMNYDDNSIDRGIKGKKIIGFKNVTPHAGSTTLIYLLHTIAKKYNKDVLSIEINKNDFKIFHTNKMISASGDNIKETLDSAREEVILVDLNDSSDNDFCDDIIYLIEPSIIKLNWLMMTNKMIFDELKSKKVILNKSMLSDTDIPVLEKEAGMKFYFNIEPVNDRKNNSVIEKLFNSLVMNE